MSFAWEDYMHLAVELVSEEPNQFTDEARLRCAISRLYYAAHCTARNHLRDEEKFYIPPSGEAHQDVIKIFEKGDRHRKGIATHLRRMWDDRRAADYDDNISYPHMKARDCMRRCAAVLAFLSEG